MDSSDEWEDSDSSRGLFPPVPANQLELELYGSNFQFHLTSTPDSAVSADTNINSSQDLFDVSFFSEYTI